MFCVKTNDSLAMNSILLVDIKTARATFIQQSQSNQIGLGIMEPKGCNGLFD